MGRMDKSEDYISSWKAGLGIDLSELKVFLEEVSHMDKTMVGAAVKAEHQRVFSEMDCLKCANCCKTTPPLYTNKDVKRIAGYLKTTPKQFKRKYTIEDVNGELIGIKVPCSFLNTDYTCSIYEVRPQACRTYPHTDDPDFALRSSLNYNNTIVCPAAHAIVSRLKSSMEKQNENL
jgi:Fe-S-cluster containining protein